MHVMPASDSFSKDVLCRRLGKPGLGVFEYKLFGQYSMYRVQISTHNEFKPSLNQVSANKGLLPQSLSKTFGKNAGHVPLEDAARFSALLWCCCCPVPL